MQPIRRMAYKNSEIREAEQHFLGEVAAVLNHFLTQRQERAAGLAARYQQLYEAVQDEEEQAGPAYVLALQAFRAQLFAELTHWKDGLEQEGYGHLPQQMHAACKTYVEAQASQLVVREVSRPYQLSALRNPLLYPSALWFNFKLRLRSRLRRLRNAGRRLLRKAPQDVTVYRNRRLPFRALLSEHIYSTYWPGLLPLFDDFLSGQSKLVAGIWALDEALDNYSFSVLQEQPDAALLPEGLLSRLKVLVKGGEMALEAFLRAHQELIQSAFNEADRLLPKLDTLYVSQQRFRPEVLRHQVQQGLHKSQRKLGDWNRTYLALADDWAMDVELSHLYFSVFGAYHRMQHSMLGHLEEDLDAAFEQIEVYLSDSRRRLEEEAPGNPGAVLRKERRNAQHDLADRHLAGLVEKLSISFTGDFDLLKTELDVLLQGLAEQRTYIKQRGYFSGASASSIEEISPRELLQFEAIPALQKRIKTLRLFSEQRLEEARLQLMGLATVWDFSLESALLLLGEADGGADKALEGALEGARRAREQLREARSLVQSIPEQADAELKSGIIQFNLDVQKLKNTDNVFELNLKVARIKALEQSRRLRKQILEGFRTLLPQLWRLIKSGYLKLLRLVKDIKQRVGFVEHKKYMTFELSEFINETQEVLRQLPFVYQRLFQLTPTNETRFFVNREKELGELKQAWANWQKDRFITVAVIGDKGSGVSSLLNHFLAETHITIPVLRATLGAKNFTLAQYLDFFNELFQPDQPFTSNEILIAWLNQGESRVVVIENLQHFYLKQVNGFENLQRLFELMSNTMKKVFWTGAFTTHTWAYLDKTLYISNYFTNEVFLQALSTEAIEEIITRRNKISGFRLHFLSDPETRERKDFAAMDEREQQVYLREQLFRKLSRLSYGNISLAQLYWLRQTRKVHAHSIDIGYIKEIDFSFIKELKAEELFVLQTIVLHDGLCLTDFCSVMGKSEAAAKNLLIPMLEKGFLIRPRQKFTINPIVFNPVVNYLHSRNFIS